MGKNKLPPELQRKLKGWERRMKKKEKKEQEREEEKAENLRQDYLKRTGRKEMKP